MAEILVCDDDRDIVEAIEIYLTQEGHHILKAYDGEQAIRALQSNPVDLLIIDVMMPKLDGIALINEVLPSHPSLQVIFFSGYSDKEYLKNAIKLEAVDYLYKPLQLHELIGAVEKAKKGE